MLKGKQIVVLAGAIMLAAILYLAPRKTADKQEKTEENSLSKKEDLQPYIEGQIALLNAEEKKIIKSFQQILNKSGTDKKEAITDSLVQTLDKAKLPSVAAYYCEQLAVEHSNEKNWLSAAFHYFDGFKANNDSILHDVLLNKAIMCYKKVLELNPSNLDAKTDLGVCYTETNQPMQGIMLLREVVSANPNHENAQMNLGILSVRSRQYDKAADRFNKVLSINPAHTEVYLYLGECYSQTGQLEKAIEAFKNYKNKGNDPELKKQAQQYIDKINDIKTAKK